MRTLKFIIILLIFHFPIFAHYHWVSVGNYSPESDTLVDITVSSGHSFPKSGFLLSKRLIFKTRLISSENTTDFDLIKSGKSWTGKTKMSRQSVNYIEMILKKKQNKEPLYFARAVLFNKNITEGILPLSTGNGLEIVPKMNLSLIKKNEISEFQILMNGIPVKGTIRVIREGGGSSFINSNKNGIIAYKFKKPGKYLFITNHKSVGASLTFFISGFK